MTVANKITITRIFISLVVFVMLWVNTFATIVTGIVLFMLATVSDVIDGIIARKTKTTTSFGAIADPFADKILIMAAFLAFAAIKEINVPLWGVFIIMLRELTISTLRALAALHGKVMKADSYAKLKTAVQMVCAIIIMLLLLLLKAKANAVIANTPLKWLYSNAPGISFWLTIITARVTLLRGIIYIFNNFNFLRKSWSKKTSK